MMHRVVQAIALPDYTLVLCFDDGLLRVLDMKPYIETGGVWQEIAATEVFTHVKVQEDLGGLEWPGEIDFCPDTAFRVSRPVPPKLLRELIISHASRDGKEPAKEKTA